LKACASPAGAALSRAGTHEDAAASHAAAARSLLYLKITPRPPFTKRQPSLMLRTKNLGALAPAES